MINNEMFNDYWAKTITYINIFNTSDCILYTDMDMLIR